LAQVLQGEAVGRLPLAGARCLRLITVCGAMDDEGRESLDEGRPKGIDRIVSHKPVQSVLYTCPSESGLSKGTEARATRSSHSSRCPSPPAVLTKAANPATAKALNAIWEIQGIAYRRPGDPMFGLSCGLASPAGRSLSAPRCSTAGGHVHSDELDQRCDDVMQSLLRDGKGWGRVQERQARLLHENRYISRESAKVREEVGQELLESSKGMRACFSKKEQLLGKQLPSPILSPTRLSSDTVYRCNFGGENAKHLAGVKALARSDLGHQRASGISSWGAERTIVINR